MPSPRTSPPPADFSLVRLIRAHLRDADLKPGEGAAELDAVAAAFRAASRTATGPLRGHTIPVTRAESGGLTAGSFSGGGALVGGGAVSLAESLQPQLLVESLGARRVQGKAGDLLVSSPAEVASGWCGEDGEISAASALFGAALLTPRDAAVRLRMSRSLFKQAGAIAESELRGLLSRSLAATIEKGIVVGSGANAELLGLANDPQLNRETFASANAQPTRERLGELVGELLDNGGDLDSIAVMASSADYGDSQAGTTPLVDHTADGRRRAAGVAIAFSPHLPSGRLIVADWSRLVVSYIGEPQLVIDPFTDGDRGIINMTLFQSVSYATERRELLTVAIKES
jgi:hypothetical protein